MDYMQWIIGVTNELDDVNDTRLAVLESLRLKHQESRLGIFRTLNYGDIPISDRNLCELVFEAHAENWLWALARDEGRTEDAARHLAAYEAAMAEIMSGRFADEMRGAALRILD
jgi:hypothetical protein